MGALTSAILAGDVLLTIHSLLAAKSSTFPAIKAATDTIINVVNEVNTHKGFCAKWGVTEEELLSTPESAATTAYGAFILDVGLQGEWPFSPPVEARWITV